MRELQAICDLNAHKLKKMFVLIHCCSDAWADLLIQLSFSVDGEVASDFCYEVCIKLTVICVPCFFLFLFFFGGGLRFIFLLTFFLC